MIKASVKLVILNLIYLRKYQLVYNFVWPKTLKIYVENWRNTIKKFNKNISLQAVLIFHGIVLTAMSSLMQGLPVSKQLIVSHKNMHMPRSKCPSVPIWVRY